MRKPRQRRCAAPRENLTGTTPRASCRPHGRHPTRPEDFMLDAPRTLVAGVDSSTQSTKVVVCDAATGEIVRSGRAPHPDGTSVHPDRWWDAFSAATADGLLDDVAAIAVGGQQHGMCALDESGDVVRDALLWNDTRSAQASRDLLE